MEQVLAVMCMAWAVGFVRGRSFRGGRQAKPASCSPGAAQDLEQRAVAPAPGPW